MELTHMNEEGRAKIQITATARTVGKSGIFERKGL